MMRLVTTINYVVFVKSVYNFIHWKTEKLNAKFEIECKSVVVHYIHLLQCVYIFK